MTRSRTSSRYASVSAKDGSGKVQRAACGTVAELYRASALGRIVAPSSEPPRKHQNSWNQPI